MLVLTAATTTIDADLYSFGYFDAAIGYQLPLRSESAYLAGFYAYFMEVYGAPF